MSIITYSTTPASNTSLFPENMPPSSVNDSARQMQADIRDGVIMRVDTKAEMSALTASDLAAGDRLYMNYRATEGDKGGGIFRVTKSDISTEVALDTAEGVYVPFDSDITGASGGFIRVYSGFPTLKMFGAVMDGSTNDSAALTSMDALGGGIIEGGTASIGANVTLTGDYIFQDGGIIKAATSYTVTISGSITAGNFQIFSGDIALSKVHKVKEIPITWFGAVAADLSTDTADGSLADANMIAIKKAVAMATLSGTNGTYRTPPVVIPAGLWLVDDDDADGVGVELTSYCTLIGHGFQSVIRPVDSAAAFDIISITDDAANNIIIDNFQIYGEASAQSNAQTAIKINPTTNPVIYSRIGKGMMIKEMKGYGIHITGAGLDNSRVEPFHVRDSTLHNMLVTGCDRLTVSGTMFRTSKSGYSGLAFSGAGCLSATIENCHFDENNTHGLLIDSVTGRFTIQNNRASTNGAGAGYYIDGCPSSIIVGNFAEANATQGFYINDCDNSLINGNVSRSNTTQGITIGNSSYVNVIGNSAYTNQNHGIILSTVDNSNINGNESYGNGQATDDTYSGIRFESNSDDNNVQGNIVRHGGGSNQHKYGIEINDTASGTNLVTNNDLKNAGRTSNLYDNGTSTSTTAGNRT